MKRILLALLLFTGAASYAQPFAIGSTTITFNDPSRSNRAIETDIYYPATTAGNNTPVAGTAGDRFPVVVFGHGFLMTVDAYQNIWTELVAQGYIVALPKTEGSLLPNHTNFGRDLAFVVSALQSAGATSGNFFFEKVAGTSCVMGHSMGGGASFLAAQYNSSITAIAGLAPAETNPAASAAAQSISIPALIFAGANDCVTPAGAHSLLIYNSLASSCKSYINITGGSHCQFANSNFNCSFGELTCSPGPAISRTAQQAVVNQYLVPWLNFRLKNDCQGWFSMQTALGTDPAVTLTQSCATPLVCPSPLGRRTNFIRATSAVLKWKLPACYTSFQIRYKLASSTVWNVVSVGNATTYYLTGLTPGTTYDWSVRNFCNSTQTSVSAWGPKQTFTTLLVNPVARIASDEPANLNFTLLPNPGNGKFDIRFENATGSTVQIEIYNTIGKLEVKTGSTLTMENESLTYDLSALPAGLYFVKITDGSIVQTRRLIIQ